MTARGGNVPLRKEAITKDTVAGTPNLDRVGRVGSADMAGWFDGLTNHVRFVCWVR